MAEEKDKPEVELEEFPKNNKLAGAPSSYQRGRKGLLGRFRSRKKKKDKPSKEKDKPSEKKSPTSNTLKKEKYKDVYEDQIEGDIETNVGMLLNGQPYDSDAGLKPGKLKFVVNAKRTDGMVEKHERTFNLDYLFEKKKVTLHFFQDQKYTNSFEIEKDGEAEIWVAIYDENNQGVNDLKIILKIEGKEYYGDSSGGGTTPSYVEFKIPDLDVGEHDVVAELKENPLYEADPVQSKITVKEKFNIEFTTVPNGEKVDANKEIGLHWKVSDEKLVKYYKLLLYDADKKEWVGNEKTILGKKKETIYTWKAPNVSINNCYLVVRAYDHKKEYLGQATNNDAFAIEEEVKKLIAEFNNPIINEGEVAEITIKVKDAKTKKARSRVLAIVECNGQERRDHTGMKGTAKVKFADLSLGEHEFIIKLEHKDYIAEEYDGTITVNEKPIRVWFKRRYNPQKPVSTGQEIKVVLLKEGDDFDQVYIAIAKGRTVINEFKYPKENIFESMNSSSIIPLEGVDELGEYELVVVATKGDKKVGGSRVKFTVKEGISVRFKQGYKPTGVLKPLEQKPVKWIVSGKGNYDSIILELEKEGSKELDSRPFIRGADIWEDWRAPEEPGNYTLKVFLLNGDMEVGKGDETTFTVKGEKVTPPGGNGNVVINIVNITNINGLEQGKKSLIILLNQLLQKINILIDIDQTNTGMSPEIVELLQNINLTLLNLISILNKTNIDLEKVNQEIKIIQKLLQQLINQGSNITTINNMISIINNIVNEINIRIEINEKKKKKKWGPYIHKLMGNLKDKSEVSYVLIFEGHSRSITVKVNQVLRALERADQSKISSGDMKKINIFKQVMMRYHEKFKSNRPYFNSVREEFAKLDKKLDVDNILAILMDKPLKKELKELLYTKAKITKKRDMDRLRTIVKKAKNESKLTIINTDKLKRILIKYGLIHT